ncbi:MAG: protein-glutamate O-methyltransferase CheR [Deltaproteobacteria bacterium]|nr:protein-glutamate O-methyltransferase CheR [Deltaproteobacteria bacterium]
MIIDREYRELCEIIEKEAGIALSPTRTYLVENRLAQLMLQQHISSYEELLQKLEEGMITGLLNQIVDAVTTNETFWFRDPKVWSSLRDHLLPKMLHFAEKEGRKVRIWCAACSTGQEPYSLSMLAHDQGWKDQLEIVATDISSSALFSAISGRYYFHAMRRGFIGQWERYRDHFFRDAGGGIFELEKSVRKTVVFQKMNLVDAFPPGHGPFDLVLLRNVIYYLSAMARTDVLKRTTECLRWRAALLLGETENLSASDEGLVQEPVAGIELIFPRRSLRSAS